MNTPSQSYGDDNYYNAAPEIVENVRVPGRMKGLHPNWVIQDEIQQFGNSGPGQYLNQDGTPMVKFKSYPEDLRNPATSSFQMAPRGARHAGAQPRQPLPYKRALNMKLVYSCVGAGFALLVLALVLVLASGNSGNPNTSVLTVQPASASQVAASLGCTNFKDHGGSTKVGFQGILDTGNCMKDGVKYAINTFINTEIRDTWLKAAEPLGVNPKWESATSVTYKSVT